MAALSRNFGLKWKIIKKSANMENSNKKLRIELEKNEKEIAKMTTVIMMMKPRLGKSICKRLMNYLFAKEKRN